ncbi:sulfatase [Tichowtungia aerotolerans]|uniref:Sulfatase-like hydrolase/transferase n=1 Tax=Tichowtungia aerotolerans TaxID=2697043 RepID=A0A6P1MCN0_9BACT|nr:sulfatase [Tichowtungia aerotolerans]QHI69818.1 sulfatase-like hydrolase/transferase [Tichowtungia aerotolerans]
MNCKKLSGFGALALVAMSSQVHAKPSEQKMNVVFFLVDDMGWMDSSVYGSQFYKTPALERLAQSSVRFVNAYSASPLCSPSRAGIMSGQYPARHGLTTAWGHLPIDPDLPEYQDPKPWSPVLLPNSKRVLELEQYTVAEAFRDAGYRTGFVGKWHLGLDEAYWPEQQGFEFTFHGAPDAGPRTYFSPYQFKAGTVADGPDGEYLTDRATEEALRYIHNGDQRPFFLCLWHWAVHGPWYAKQEQIDYFKHHPDPTGLQKSPTMAAMLESMDESLGRLLDDLEKSGLDENTIIIFTSDNGGVVKKGPKEEQGIPATCNAPLRNGKASVFEGGTRVPALIRWPGVTDQSRVDETPIMGIDYYPTLLEMCGIAPNPQQIIDGVSLVPLLKGRDIQRDGLFCFFPHSFGKWSPAGAWVRQGDWKLIEVFDPGRFYPEPYELYNLNDDIGETQNLADRYPERVAAMKAMLQQHYKDTNARMPIPNPDYEKPDLSAAQASPVQQNFQGWIESGPGNPLSLKDGGLCVDTRGIATSRLPNAKGPLRVCIRTKVSGVPHGVFFWREGDQKQFGADRRIPFHLKSGEWEEHSIDFSAAAPLAGLRIDLGLRKQAPAQVEWIKLFKADGTLLQPWDFSID